MLKISGESLKGDTPFGIDTTAVTYLASQIGEAAKLGVETVSYTHLTLPTIYSE